MEEKLLELFKLAKTLNEKNNKYYAQICYSADERSRIEIAIRSTEDHTFLRHCYVCLSDNSLENWNNITELFKTFAGNLLKNYGRDALGR